MSFSNLSFVFVCVATSVGVFLVAKVLGMEAEPFWIALPILCIPALVVIIRKFPAALIPPVIFLGSLKVQPAASTLDFHDPTLWALCLLSVAMLAHAVFPLIDSDRPSLGSLVGDQAEGIVTYLLFVGVVALSYLYSLAPEYAFKELTHFLAIGSLLFFSPLVLVRSETDFRHLIASSVVLGLVITGQRFLGVMNYSYLHPALRADYTTEDLTKIGVGELIGMAMLVLLLPPKTMRVRVPRWLLLLCAPCFAAGLTVSIARGPLISFMAVLLTSILTSKADVGLVSRKVMACGVVLLVVPTIALSLLWVRNAAEQKIVNKESELTKLLELSDPGGSAGMRLAYYKAALEGFAEKPLTGWGLGSFSVYATGKDTREYPHNVLLQVAMEQGMFGLSALAVFVMMLARALGKIVSVTRGEWAFILWIVVYHVVVSMFSGDLDDQRPLVLWCGLAFASWRILKHRLEDVSLLSARFRKGAFVPGYVSLSTRQVKH